MVSLVVVAGGESRRMGCNKALVHLEGKPLIQWVIERLGPYVDEVLVAANDAETYSFLGVPVCADRVSGMGALGGLYSALFAASGGWAAVVACDMPFASPALLQYERELADNDYDLIMPRTAAGREPFHALYRVATCLPLVRGSLDTGERRVGAWMEGARVQEIDAGTVARLDPRGTCFLNVNAPADLIAAASELEARGAPRELAAALAG